MAIVVWSGLYLGAIYALCATCFTVAMIPTGVFNFAQGAIIVGGSFLMYEWLSVHHLSDAVALLITAVAGAVAGVLCEVLAVRPLRWRRGEVGDSTIVTTVGLSTAIVGMLGVKWGYNPLEVPFRGPQGSVHILGVEEQPVEIAVVVAAVLVAVALHLWFRWTRTGRACLAVAEDRTAAMLRGINVSRLSVAAFAAAGLIGGLVGALSGPITYAIPTLGSSLALGGFVALALGGSGSFLGGLFGGLIVGLVSSFGSRYIGANYDNVSVLVCFLIVLGIRPMGLGGAKAARSV